MANSDAPSRGAVTHGQAVPTVSQPLAVIPSQFTWPALHAMVHTPVRHTGDEFANDGHVVAQVPQRSGLVCRSVSQPLARSASQSPNPVRHT